MSGTRAGQLKTAKKLGKARFVEMGRKGGKNVPPEKRTFSVDKELAAKAGKAGGLARAAKYQNPNFDKAEYNKRRKKGLRGQEKPHTIVSRLSADEYLRRTNLKEFNKQKGVNDDSPDNHI